VGGSRAWADCASDRLGGRQCAGPILEELAVASLDDTDPQVAGSAARYLGEHGSAKSQDALWRRYEAWSLQWRGRESEIRCIYGDDNSNTSEADLGQALATALATGQAWVADDGMVRRILELAVGQQMRQQIESAISTRPPPRR